MARSPYAKRGRKGSFGADCLHEGVIERIKIFAGNSEDFVIGNATSKVHGSDVGKTERTEKGAARTGAEGSGTSGEEEPKSDRGERATKAADEGGHDGREESNGNRLSIVVACHSHAPLKEFWERCPRPRLAIVMPW